MTNINELKALIELEQIADITRHQIAFIGFVDNPKIRELNKIILESCRELEEEIKKELNK